MPDDLHCSAYDLSTRLVGLNQQRGSQRHHQDNKQAQCFERRHPLHYAQ